MVVNTPHNTFLIGSLSLISRKPDDISVRDAVTRFNYLSASSSMSPYFHFLAIVISDYSSLNI